MLRALMTLLRWLGPWAAPDRAPPGPARREVRIEPVAANDRAFWAWLYIPDRRVRGAILVSPGVHFAGPADPRLDRLGRILAAAGHAVLIPFLPDYTALRVTPAVIGDLERAFEVFLGLPEVPRRIRPGVLSISFGSLPALRLAGSETWRDRIGSLLVFGGYADFARTVDFCVSGEVEGRAFGSHDPLNQPVAFINLVDYLPRPAPDPDALRAAWTDYCEATWGDEAMKEPARFTPEARRIAAGLPEDLRELFLVGCRVETGGTEMIRAALEQVPNLPELDPRAHLHDVRCPVVLAHGRDDDVIPYTEMSALAAALPRDGNVQTFLTGLYGHTGSSGLSALPELLRELRTMVRMLVALDRCGTTAA